MLDGSPVHLDDPHIAQVKPEKSPRGVQTWIHELEEGSGQVWLRRLVTGLVITMAVLLYHVFEAQNFPSPEAMDQGQLARNVAEGRGFTTYNLRPLNLYLLRKGAWAGQSNEIARMRGPIPDLENAPVYPLIWAGMMKVLPEACRNGKVTGSQATQRPPPEVAIGFLNLALFGVSSVLLYRLGLQLFGGTAAVLATSFFIGSEALWRYAYSGLSTHLLVTEVLALAALLLAPNRENREKLPDEGGEPLGTPASGLEEDSVLAGERPSWMRWGWNLSVGLLLGLMMLTRYSVGWMALPTTAWIAWRSGKAGRMNAFFVAMVFLATISPWMVRNWRLSGTPFGTAGYALLTGTPGFPGFKLERSQHPAVETALATEVAGKMGRNLVDIVENDLPRLGASFCVPLFLAGLLLTPPGRRWRKLQLWFLGCLLVLLPAEAIGRTEISRLSPEINSEKLTILLFPLVCLFAGGTVDGILRRREFPFPLLATFTRTLISVMVSLPMVLVVFLAALALLGMVPRRHFVVVDPPYRPATIAAACDWVPAGSLMMSDIPWAVAWYGNREAMWMPLRIKQDGRDDFYQVHLLQRQVKAILLSPLTSNGHFRDEFLLDPDRPWGLFYLDLVARGQLPEGFPLTFVESDLLKAGYCFVTASPWWRSSPDGRK